MNKDITYICCLCGKECGTSDKWTDKQAVNEAFNNYGSTWLEADDIEVICDTCYKKEKNK